MELYTRNFLDGLTADEEKEYERILSEETKGAGGFGRKNLYHLYPEAARHFRTLFPNHHLDIVDVKANPNFETINEDFKNLILRNITERSILNYINQNHAFHIIAAILQGANFSFGHHCTYLFPEFQLGTSYKADYLLIGRSSGGHEFVFVELENPYEQITIQNGELGTTFRKGISQVNDWRRWLEENYSSLSEYFEKHSKRGEPLPREFHKYDATRIHYVVVAGMRKDFRDKTYRIAREYRDREKIQLLHYENLYDYACKIPSLSTF